jgi:protein O-mannosyl-transferase
LPTTTKPKPTPIPRVALFASPEKRTPVLCLLLAVVTLALYNPVSRHPFVNYDDDRYVTDNPHVRSGLTWDTAKWALTSTEEANWHPLTWMSHALDWSLFHSNPAGHHFTSVLLHALNVALLFLVLTGSTRRVGPSLFVAVLFAVHPLNVESVAWIAERKNVLCTSFFLLTLITYRWYAQKPHWERYLAIVLLFAAALAAKPMAITLPFVLLLWDYWPLQRVQQSHSSQHPGAIQKSWPQLVLEKLSLFALSAASAVITLQAQQSGGATRSIAQFPFSVRLENAICSYAMYLWKTIWPASLAPMYPHPGDSLPASHIALSALVLIAITVAVLRFRSRRYLLVGWLWFLGTLVPVIGLVQVGEAASADRYTYIPLIGIFVMIAFGAADIAEEKSIGTAGQVTPAGLVLIALAFVTHRQIGYWQSNYDLWTHTLAITQNNFVAQDNLGGALLLEGKPDEAFPHFRAAAQINPRDPMSHSNLGAYLQSHNRIDEAIDQYDTVIALTSDAGLLSQTYANLGVAERNRGEDAEARTNFERALRLNPDQSNAWLGLGLLEQKQGNLQNAILELSRSAQLHPDASTFVDLGRVLEQANRPGDALAAYQSALKLQLGMAEAEQAIDALQRTH